MNKQLILEHQTGVLDDLVGEEAHDYSTKSLKNKKVWLQISGERVSDARQRIMGYIWLSKPDGKDDEKQMESELFNSQL